MTTLLTIYYFTKVGRKRLCVQGVLLSATAMCFFLNVYMVFGALADMKEFPLQHVVFICIETRNIVCEHPLRRRI